jgi:hypothetical protein
LLHNPEYRLTSSDGQDRSVKHKNYARTTDKGFPQGRIYSLISHNNLKNKMRVKVMLEGLEGLRVGNSDALTNLAHLKSSLIDMEARQGDMGQAKAA